MLTMRALPDLVEATLPKTHTQTKSRSKAHHGHFDPPLSPKKVKKLSLRRGTNFRSNYFSRISNKFPFLPWFANNNSNEIFWNFQREQIFLKTQLFERKILLRHFVKGFDRFLPRNGLICYHWLIIFRPPLTKDFFRSLTADWYQQS